MSIQARSAFAPAWFLACAAVSAAIGMAPAPAEAGAYGTSVFVSGRDCSALSATQGCPQPGQPVVVKAIAGGRGVSTASAVVSTPQIKGFASGRVTVSGLNATISAISDSSFAGSSVRMNSTTLAFYSLTNNGKTASVLSMGGNLHIDWAFPSPADFSLPGGEGINAYAGIWSPTAFDALYPGNSIRGFQFDDCSTSGVLAYGAVGGAAAGMPAGGGSYSVGLSTAGCSGSPFVINPGQEVYVVAGLQIPTNRGGLLIADHTFSFGLDPALPDAARTYLQDNLTPGYVPEPASWTTMVLGFGALGAALRGRRRNPAGLATAS